MKLTRTQTVGITPSRPFAFDPTFHKPDHFTSGDNLWEPGIRWQTWNWQDMALGLRFVNEGTTDDPHISIDIFSGTRLSRDLISSLVTEIVYRYNLNLDLTEFYEDAERDEILSPVVKRWRGMRPGHPNSLYEYLIIGIVLQNASVRRSVQMLKALLENYGALLEFDGKELRCFWRPGRLEEAGEEELRALKVGYRARSMKRVDDCFAGNLIDEQQLRKQDRETQTRELLRLYGVGPATVSYLLFDVFHHWDFFDHISPWEQKIYSGLFFDRDPKTLFRWRSCWSVFRDTGNTDNLRCTTSGKTSSGRGRASISPGWKRRSGSDLW